MPAIRSSADVAKKWARVTPQRVDDYRDGVSSPKRSWEEATSNAQSAYESGVQKSISDKRFSKGVKAAGNEKWQSGAKIKGADRWGPGVTIAESDYSSGFGKFRDVIESTTLPPRYAKGDPRNIERVRVMAGALRSAKVGGK